MADSLQEQLRALGLARDKPEQERKKRPQESPGGGQKRKGHRPRKAGGAAGEPSLDRAWALREQQEKDEADAVRRRKLAEDRRRHEINQSIRQIVDAHRLNREDAELARNFLFRGRIRKIYVTPDQQVALTSGELGIVYLTGGYHLLAPEHLEAVRAIDSGHLVELDTGAPDEEEFPVPDDLAW